jgi:hypothetical protein
MSLAWHRCPVEQVADVSVNRGGIKDRRDPDSRSPSALNDVSQSSGVSGHQTAADSIAMPPGAGPCVQQLHKDMAKPLAICVSALVLAIIISIRAFCNRYGATLTAAGGDQVLAPVMPAPPCHCSRAVGGDNLMDWSPRCGCWWTSRSCADDGAPWYATNAVHLRCGIGP